MIVALIAVGAAPGAEAATTTVNAYFWGAGASDAVVSFYLLDDDTGEALVEVTADAVSQSGWHHSASIQVPAALDKKSHHRWAVRVDARGADGNLWLLGFSTSEGTKEKVLSENITGQTRWFVAGDQEGEGAVDVDGTSIDKD